jgi:3-isopropylmalate/(R)-2-methylmalate dehydratase large subunit
MQPKPKKILINVAGDLRLEFTQRRLLFYHLKTIYFRSYRHFVEYAGKVFEDMTMEGRMTVCNLSIEAEEWCSRSNDFDYLEGRLYAQRRCLGYSRSLLENIKTDADAKFDEELNFEASDIEPMITYGTNPGMD